MNQLFICRNLLVFYVVTQSFTCIATQNPLSAPTLLPFSLNFLENYKNFYATADRQILRKVNQRDRSNKLSIITKEFQEILKKEKSTQLNNKINAILTSVIEIENYHKKFLQHKDFFYYDQVVYNLTKNFSIDMIITYEKNMRSDYALKFDIKVPINDSSNIKLDFLDILLQRLQKFSRLCNLQKSLHMIFYEFYQAIRDTEIKYYSIIHFAYTVLEKHSNVNLTETINLLNQEFQTRDDSNRLAFKKVMLKASRSVWTCAPSSNKTYSQINSHKMHLVPNLKEFENYNSDCNYPLISPMNYALKSWETSKIINTCLGLLENCKKLKEDVCVIESENSYQYLRPEECQDNTTISKIFTHGHENCMCNCKSTNQRLRVFLGPVLSDYNNLRVITGARFRVRTAIDEYDNDVELDIEIQEGQLLPNGAVNISTLEWKNGRSNNFRKDNEPTLVFLDGQRFHLFAQDLSDFSSSRYPMILTGLQFQKEGFGVSLKIYASKVSLTMSNSSNLFISKPFSPKYFVLPIIPENLRDDYHYDRFILNNENPDDELKQFMDSDKKIITPILPTSLKLKNPDRPDYSGGRDIIDSQYTQYITLRSTSLEKDFGQHTIPFIDLQDVVTDPPTPLIGAALYHKGAKGYGGYLSLELRTFNFERFFV